MMPDARETGLHKAHTVPALKELVSSGEDGYSLMTLAREGTNYSS